MVLRLFTIALLAVKFLPVDVLSKSQVPVEVSIPHEDDDTLGAI
jgi:hypothetical protein